MTREDEWPTDVTVDEACTHLSVLRDVAGFKNLACILQDSSTWLF